MTQQRKSLFSKSIKDELKAKFFNVDKIRVKGYDLLNDPLSNKTLAFPDHERERLDLDGLLPPTILNMKEQANLYMEEYEKGVLEMAASNPDIKTLKTGVTP